MKPVTFATMKKLHKLSLNDYNRWVSMVYNSGVQDGINISEEDVIAEVSEVQLLDIILSVKGVGQKRAAAIVAAILEKGSVVNDSTGNI